MKRGLGKGLDALLGENSSAMLSESGKSNSVEFVRVNEIEPNTRQPRKRFDEEGLAELSDSIKKHGIVQPIIVRREAGAYKIIAGERRWRASKKAGLKEIPVLIKEATERQLMEIALIENLQREDLNAIEEANAYKQLIDEYEMTHNDLADTIGKSRVEITNKMRLLKLPEHVLLQIENNEITAGHARALLSLDSDDEIIRMADMIKNRQLSVRQTENYVKSIKSKEVPLKKNRSISAEILDLQDRMMKFFETKVKIQTKKTGSKIVIECPNDETLNTIIEKLEV